MPELPEVQTVCNILKSQIIGFTIKECIVNNPKIIKSCSTSNFCQMVKHQKIINIIRRGKYIIIILEKNYLIVHLRMEGRFFVFDNLPKLLNYKHVHVHFELLNKHQKHQHLLFYDTRHFATMEIIDKTIFALIAFFNNKKMGYEPLFGSIISSSVLYDMCFGKNVNIKTFLLNQKYLTGIGNIYASEILFCAQISPLTLSKNITKIKANKILKCTENILQKAIKSGGTTVFSFESAHGISGKFQQHLYVYHRQNLPCLICKTKILRIKQNGRSTFYCPKCQQ